VETRVNEIKPDTVMVELCQKRFDQLMNGATEEHFKADVVKGLTSFPKVDAFEEFIKKFFGGFASGKGLFGAWMSAVYSVLRSLGFMPGLEFIVAAQQAKKIGANLVLGDQSGDLTLSRIRNAFSFTEFLRSLQNVPDPAKYANQLPKLPSIFNFSDPRSMEEMIEKLKDRKTIRLMSGMMQESWPKFFQILLHDRDEFMSNSILKSADGGAKRIVAVVGLAHMDGMEKRLKDTKRKFIAE